MFTFNLDLARDDDFEEGDEAFDTTNLPKEDNDEQQDTSIVIYLLSRIGMQTAKYYFSF